MAKQYTAEEMREAADNFWVGGVICEVKDKDGHVVKHIKHDAVIAMLRQAADLQEREEREKLYEYATMTDDGWVGRLHCDMIELIDDTLDEGDKLVRREVGEWEEIE